MIINIDNENTCCMNAGRKYAKIIVLALLVMGLGSCKLLKKKGCGCPDFGMNEQVTPQPDSVATPTFETVTP